MKIKLLYTLMVFAAGFATAIYLLGPVSEAEEYVSYEDSGSYENSRFKEDAEERQNFDSEQVMRIVKAGADKFMDFVKVTSRKTIRLVKRKMAERKEVSKKPPD